MSTFASSDVVGIGGTHGHIKETIDGPLLLLWRAPFCDWKPLKNCTGRYVCREPKLHKQHLHDSTTTTNNNLLRPSSLTPTELMHHAYQAWNDSTTEHNDATNGKAPWIVYEFGPAPGRVDRILVLPLDLEKTTGIITYVKEQEQQQHDNNGSQALPTSSTRRRCRYVHTLNSPSGFQRKLHAVGISLD